jgi:hypothetical protein
MNNNARKLRAWKEIHDEFTAMFNNKDRNITRLKEQWRRMKQMAKKNVSKVKTYRQKIWSLAYSTIIIIFILLTIFLNVPPIYFKI